MARIGIDARLLGIRNRGLGRYCLELVRELERLDQENEYVVFLRRENWDDWMPSNPRWRKALADVRWYTLKEQLILPWLFWWERLDLLHVPHFNAPVLYPGKFVITVHDLILEHHPDERATTLPKPLYWLKIALHRLLMRLVTWRASRILVPTQYVADDVRQRYGAPSDKLIVTEEGVTDLPALTIEQTRQRLPELGVRQPYFLYVGAAYPHKNLEFLLRAFQGLLEQNLISTPASGGEVISPPQPLLREEGATKMPQLVLAGRRDFFWERLGQYAQTLGDGVRQQVVFTGEVSDADLNVLLRGAAAFVFPSLDEGFGLPPLEAMSVGCPVVSSDTSCLPEVLGDATLLLDPRDQMAWQQAMVELLAGTALAEQLRSSGKAKAGQYRWVKMAEQTSAVYRSAIA